MPLSDELLDAVLTHACPHCGYKMKKKGSWFKACRQQYQCPSCHQMVPMGYDTKLALFKRYERLRKVSGFIASPKTGVAWLLAALDWRR
jgi:transposase-like protein